MDLRQARVVAITAIASDDVLMETLVLKGGNALEIVHRIGGRASLDLDYSLEGDLQDTADVAGRLEAALRDRFDAAGYVLFDFKFYRRPETSTTEARWGGYRAEFKIIGRAIHGKLRGELEQIRRNAHVIGPQQQRVFCIDISKHEYVKPKELRQVDSYECYVYTPPMIATEKIRALCQQLPTYPLRKNPAPRPRDFYDIRAIIEAGAASIEVCGELLGPVFAAKEVSLSLLSELHESREFHRTGWDAVQNAVAAKLEAFDFYFDYVLDVVTKLEPWWKVNAPR
jgi:hypothetical protein